MATALARVRAFAISAGTFRRIALANALMLLVIVSSGATVRLTASGLGCPKWPGCEGATKLPARDHYQQIEFSNRLISGITILLTLATWLASRWTPTMPKWARRVALATFLGALAQAPLGAITVYFDLNPWLVLSHFLLSVIAADARRDRGARGMERPRRGGAAPAPAARPARRRRRARCSS